MWAGAPGPRPRSRSRGCGKPTPARWAGSWLLAPRDHLQVGRPAHTLMDELNQGERREPYRVERAEEPVAEAASADVAEPVVQRDDPELRTDERPERHRLEPGPARERRQGASVEEVEVTWQVIAAPVAAAEEARVPRIQVRRFDEDVAARPERRGDVAEDGYRVRHVLDQLVHDHQVERPRRQANVLDAPAINLEAARLGRAGRRLRELHPGEGERRAPVTSKLHEEMTVAAADVENAAAVGKVGAVGLELGTLGHSLEAHHEAAGLPDEVVGVVAARVDARECRPGWPRVQVQAAARAAPEPQPRAPRVVLEVGTRGEPPAA